MKSIMYGLKLKGKDELLSISSDGCGVFSLSNRPDNPWILEDKKKVAYVMANKIPHYDSDYEFPMNPFRPEELELVKVERILTVDERPYLKVRFTGTLDEGERFFLSREDGSKNREMGFIQGIVRETIFLVQESSNEELYEVISDTKGILNTWHVLDNVSYVKKADFEIIEN